MAQTSNVSPLGIANAYDWLDDNQVNTTSESFFCPGGNDGMAQEWYARYHGIAVFRAAGSFPEQDTELGCRPMNSICVGGMRSVGGNWEMWPSSSWMNPATAAGDREEPDIVALSSNVDLIEVQTDNDTDHNPLTGVWDNHRDGTSYAAPAMATLGVLLKQACGGHIDEMELRAQLMTSAWSINPDGSRYSTPGSLADCGNPPDCKDGAGAPTADNAALFCGLGDTGVVTRSRIEAIDLQGGTPAAPWMDQTGKNPFNVYRLETLSLEPGDRLRVTFTWNGCPGSKIGTGPAPLSADFDIWLCIVGDQTCVKHSRSFDNNVEGFDYTVPSGGGAIYSLWVGYDPENSPGCPYPWVNERAAYAWAVGRSEDFEDGGCGCRVGVGASSRSSWFGLGLAALCAAAASRRRRRRSGERAVGC